MLSYRLEGSGSFANYVKSLIAEEVPVRQHAHKTVNKHAIFLPINLCLQIKHILQIQTILILLPKTCWNSANLYTKISLLSQQ